MSGDQYKKVDYLASLPIDLLNPVANPEQSTSIFSVVSEADAIYMMGKLAQTSKKFHGFFQPTLEELATQRALLGVLKPTDKNVKEAKKVLLAAPKFLYKKSKAHDYSGRLIAGSAWQAALGVGATGWLNWMWDHVIEPTDSRETARLQYNEQFGKPDKRKAKMLAQLDEDLKEIAAAIQEDPCLDFKPTRERTEKALQVMRDHLTPKPDEVIQAGEYFPLEMLIKVCRVCLQHRLSPRPIWDTARSTCYSHYVIGYVLRFCTGEDMLRFKKGFLWRDRNFDPYDPLSGSFDLKVEGDKVALFPLDEDPQFRLGFNFVFSIYYGETWPGRIYDLGRRGYYGTGCLRDREIPSLKKLCKTRADDRERFKHWLQEPTNTCQSGCRIM